MRLSVVVCLACLLPFAAPGDEWEVIEIPVGAQGGARAALPRPERGMSSDTVLARFGEPISITAPVGEPPISRWTYADFTVYFEGDTVIHSVLPHTPAHRVPADR